MQYVKYMFKNYFYQKTQKLLFSPYLQIGRQKNPKKGLHWLSPGSQIFLIKNLTKFKEIQDFFFLMISTLILGPKYIQVSFFYTPF